LTAADLPVSGTETSFEINFAVMKFKHTIKKEKKNETVQSSKEILMKSEEAKK